MPDVILTDQHGNDLQLYDFYGHVILFVVSSAWSASDALLTEELPELWSEHRDRGFIVIQLLIEDEAGYPAEVSDLVTWADDMNLAYPVVLDPGETLFDDLISAGTFAAAIPSYLLLDRTMTIDSSYTGYGQTEHESRLSVLLGN
jgi:peroxiredoxin